MKIPHIINLLSQPICAALWESWETGDAGPAFQRVL